MIMTTMRSPSKVGEFYTYNDHIYNSYWDYEHAMRRSRIEIEKILTKARAEETKAQLEKRYNGPVWITADQELVPLKTIESSHLVNIINMLTCELLLINTILNSILNFGSDINGSLLIHSMSYYESYEKWYDWIYKLYTEAENRNIEFKKYKFLILYPRNWHIRGGLF